jgi:hypothetical protein
MNGAPWSSWRHPEVSHQAVVLVATAAAAAAAPAAAATTAAAAVAVTTAAAAAAAEATAAAAAAAAVAAAATAAAATTAAGLILGSVDADRAAVERRPVHCLLRRSTCARVLETHEPEAARTPGLTVRHDLRLGDRTEAAKRLAQAIVRCIPAQTADKKLH